MRRQCAKARQRIIGLRARLPAPMLVIVALANKMARIVWALMARGGTYRAPAAAKKFRGRDRESVRRSTGEYGATVTRQESGKSRLWIHASSTRC